jgi:UDP-N-acetylmuramoyl-tripeptide--D-alanyl-D-alanine ligase
MKLKNFLYLTQLEEYDPIRITNWLKSNPNREVIEIKKKLIWTIKIKLLYFFATIFFFLPPEKSVILGLKILKPFDVTVKFLVVLLAKIKLFLFHPHLQTIVITGSWGKTTTKEALFTIIKTKYQTAKTLENFNTLLGISKTILKLPFSTQIFICEAGAYYSGDIATVCRLLKPQIGIITAVGSMHLERFGSLKNILKTKMELAQNLPKNGLLLLPSSIDPKPFHLKVNHIIYFDKPKQIYQSITDYLEIKNWSTDFSPPEHRLQIIKNGTITIIDDTYNSNPAGFALALATLKSFKTSNRILVTPGMIELGSLQASENSKAAKAAAAICNHLIFVGQTNRHSLNSGALLAKSKAEIHLVDTFTQAQQLFSELITPGAVILLENDLPDNYF